MQFRKNKLAKILKNPLPNFYFVVSLIHGEGAVSNKQVAISAFLFYSAEENRICNLIF